MGLNFQMDAGTKPFRRKLSQPEFTAWKVVRDVPGTRDCKPPHKGGPGWLSLIRGCRVVAGRMYADSPDNLSPHGIRGGRAPVPEVLIEDCMGALYPAGFHCYLRRKDARRVRRAESGHGGDGKICILKVRIRSRDVLATGVEEIELLGGFVPTVYAPVVVASSMNVMGPAR